MSSFQNSLNGPSGFSGQSKYSQKAVQVYTIFTRLWTKQNDHIIRNINQFTQEVKDEASKMTAVG